MRGPEITFRIAAALMTMLPVCAAEESVALVESITGQANLREPGSQARIPIAGLEWIKAGAAIEVGADSKLTIILLNGHRYELEAGAKAAVSAEAVKSTRGDIRELKPLPPLPTLAPIADKTLATSAAVRFRGATEIRNLYPRDGMAVIAGSATLTCAAVPQAYSYEMELTNASGDRIAQYRTASTSANIPAGMLADGSRYSWRVRAIGPDGVIGQGAGNFTTISKPDLERRKEFAKAAKELEPGPTGAALLGDFDFRLGLLREAQQELENALGSKPGDAAIQNALRLVQAALAEKTP